MSDAFDDSRGTGQSGRDLPAAEPSARPRFSLRSLFIATMAICILLAVLVPVIRAARRASQRMACSNNMKSIALALHNYHDVYKKFPWAITYADDGTPMHSWRVRIVPYLRAATCFTLLRLPRTVERAARTDCLADDIPDDWQRYGWHVHIISAPCPPLYRCPSALQSQNPMCTNYVMLIDDRPGKPNGPPHRPGSVPPSLDDKSAVIIIEIADSDIHWMEPRDVLLSELSMKINDRSKRSLSSYHGGACIAHADGTVELLDDATTEERVRELLAQ